MKAFLNMLAPELEICAALQLTAIQSGRHHWHEEGEGKVGQWQSREMWVALLRPSSDSGLPRVALVYARVTDVVLCRERLPDWERVAVVWRPGGRSGSLRYSDPLDVESDPMASALRALDLGKTGAAASTTKRAINVFYRSESASLDLDVSTEVTAHGVIERCAIDILLRIGAGEPEVCAIAERWDALAQD
jgi:hypothetical protein